MNLEHFSKVGDLLDFIEKYKIPRDSNILVQRIEDCYYEGCDISGFTGQLEDSSWGKLPEGSKTTPWETIKKETDFGDSEYTPVWCPVKYKNDNNLYLDLHY